MRAAARFLAREKWPVSLSVARRRPPTGNPLGKMTVLHRLLAGIGVDPPAAVGCIDAKSRRPPSPSSKGFGATDEEASFSASFPAAPDCFNDASAPRRAPHAGADGEASTTAVPHSEGNDGGRERGIRTDDAGSEPTRRLLPTSRRQPLRCDSRLEHLALAYGVPFDVILGHLSKTSRALLAEASPALEAALLVWRPTEPLRVVETAACVETLQLLRWAVRRGCDVKTHGGNGGADLCIAAAREGRLDVLAALIDMGARVDAACVAAAARAGRLDVVRFLRAHPSAPEPNDGDPRTDPDAASGPASRRAAPSTPGRPTHADDGRGEACASMSSVRIPREACEWDATALVAAAAGGHVEVMRWMINEGGCPVDGAATCVAAAAAGQTTALRVARRELRCEWGAEVATAAAAGGHLGTLRWARRAGCPWHVPAVACAAAAGGHVGVLRWVLRGRRRLKRMEAELGTVAAAAAEAGRVDVLGYLFRMAGGPRACASKYVMDCAARGGHVASLAWLRRKGAPFDAYTSAYAAGAGRLDALRWLRRAGCEWTALTAARAANGEHFEVLRWAREDGCEWDERVALRLVAAGRMDILAWALEAGCPLPGDVRGAMELIGHMSLSREQRRALFTVLGVAGDDAVVVERSDVERLAGGD